MSVSDFMAHAAAPRPMASNSEWGAQYAAELRQMIIEQSRRAPRSTQRHLGPSELGQPCDRQVVAKMANAPSTNHLRDPWASIVGTAIHSWLDDAFTKINERLPSIRFLTEQRVFPDDEHPGTADLYDGWRKTLGDWKALGHTSLSKLIRNGPPIHYRMQLFLYARGYQRLGFPVDHVALIALPRTESSLSGLYVWTHTLTPDDEAAVDQLLARTKIRHELATEVSEGRMDIMQVPAVPDDSYCIWCPIFRPEAAHDGGRGCPGPRLPKQ